MQLLDRMSVIEKVALPLSSLAAYGVLYAAYWLFYLRFDMGPDDVGLDRWEMLRRSWPLPTLLAAALFLSVLIIRVAMTTSRGKFLLLLVLWLVISGVIGGTFGGTWALIHQGSRRVQTGKALEDVEFRGIPLLSPRIQPVYSIKFHGAPPLTRVDTLMYLGSTKKFFVVYDYQSDKSIPIPKARISKLCAEELAVTGSCP
jgi:hypothetical protein